MQAVLGQKLQQSQRFLENGTRVPVTVIAVTPNPVTAIRTQDKNGYTAVQIGFGTAKKPSKSLQGIAKQAKLTSTPTMFREVKTTDDSQVTIGDLIKATDVFKPGDIVQVTGTSKGKGWAGGVKRHHFKGGPRTHGQSDRERAPGSIGQTTTPGRVYRGKRMAGHMGHEKVTVKNLKVIDVTPEQLLIAGLVPGPLNNIVLIQKTGESKKFVPLFSIVEPEPETPAEAQPTEAPANEVRETVVVAEETPAGTAEQEAVAEVIAEDAATTSVQEAVEEKPATTDEVSNETKGEGKTDEAVKTVSEAPEGGAKEDKEDAK